MFVDLHIHSWYSSGTLSPTKIVKKAKERNIGLISICDHNSTAAYTELYELCMKSNIKLINGIEIHTHMDKREYHLLCYGVKTQNKNLNDILEYNKSVLTDADIMLIKRISEDFDEIFLSEFLKYERNLENGGWNSLDYLKSKGIIKNISDFFKLMQRYEISISEKFLHPYEVIKIIQKAGGFAVVAHIADSTEQDIYECKKAVSKLLDLNADGFECYYPSHGLEVTNFLIEFCRKKNLIITAGSDDHGGFNIYAGGIDYSMGAMKIDSSMLNLKKLDIDFS